MRAHTLLEGVELWDAIAREEHSMVVCEGDWVVLDEQAGEITKTDHAKVAVALVDGPTKWRTQADVRPLFGSDAAGRKELVEVGDWLRLKGDAVGQCLKVDGGRINVRLTDGKVLWRGFADVTPPASECAAQSGSRTPPTAPGS